MTKLWAIGLVIFCTLLTSAAQVFLKVASKSLSLSVIALITNVPLVVGMLLYVTAGVLLVIALRGGELSVLYPLIATSFIWVTLLSAHFFGEPLSFLKWMGVVSILGGVTLIGIGSQVSGRSTA